MVYDNISLAKTFLTAKDYDNARFALKNAARRLKKLERHNKELADQNGVKKIQGEIRSIQETLRKKDPTRIEKAEAAMTRWMESIRSMM